MKNIFLFSILTLLVSCKSFDKEISAINELSTNWDSLSQSTTSFSNMLNEANADYTQKIAGIEIDSAAFAQLPIEQQDKITSAKNNFMTVGAQLTHLTDDFGNILTAVNEKSEMVMQLKESIVSNSFSENTVSEANDLNQFVTSTISKINEFQETLTAVKTSVASNHSDLSGLLASAVN